jgi:hypothetical protein
LSYATTCVCMQLKNSCMWHFLIVYKTRNCIRQVAKNKFSFNKSIYNCTTIEITQNDYANYVLNYISIIKLLEKIYIYPNETLKLQFMSLKTPKFSCDTKPKCPKNDIVSRMIKLHILSMLKLNELQKKHFNISIKYQ